MRWYEIERPEINFFREQYEFLSNFYPAKLLFDGLDYKNAEAAYQAQKCRDKKDQLLFCKLSGDEAKRMGGKIEVRADWDDIKLSVMERVVQAKFAQNPLLARQLLSTGNKPLIEGNHWNDLFWGCDLKTGVGENHLGKILMSLRERLQKYGITDESRLRPIRAFGPINGITIIDEDITAMKVDCIVSSADSSLLAVNGIDGAIHRAAGPDLHAACIALDGCKTAEAKITGAFDLSAKYVIHTVGPIYQKDEDDILRVCYNNCMDLAALHHVRSIAFPAISTGSRCFPKQKAMQIAVDAAMEWKSCHPDDPMEVFFCCIDERIYECAAQRLAEYK